MCISSKALIFNKSFCVGEKNPGIVLFYAFSKKHAAASMHCIIKSHQVCLSL